MVQHPSSPELLVPEGGAADADLLSLPRPPRQERTLSLSLMAVTALLAMTMTAALAGDVSYALARAEPEDLGDLSRVTPGESLGNRFVQGKGALQIASAIRYDRPLERDVFRLAPLVGNDKIWVEMRIPPGPEGSSLVSPATFVGRLVPISSAAFRYRGLAHSVHEATGVAVRDDAWVLVDGATPSASRWTVALAALFAVFAAYNIVTMARILRKVRS
ncbi:MAG TPA: hypothetical protein VJT73_05880 [Polyangiaceae bacterium]|nr:hypothetical protein [Polyangiaceae bacterium]